jgi:glycosyltransferase involved in cell wall biosynthesis
MRIVIDLQACQSPGSRFRGIGRYSLSLARAMVEAGRGHEFWIALNGALPASIESIRAAFDGLVPQDRIVVWDCPGGPRGGRVLAELMREDFLASLRPDLVHVSSLFEGAGDGIATSIGRGSGAPVPTAVTLYDLIPLAMADLYLPDRATRAWYEDKLESLRRAGLCLAISEFTRHQGIELLGLAPEHVVNISGAAEPIFRRLPPDPGRDAALAARYGIWRPYVMYTGGFDPRKNIAGLIRAYGLLPADLRGRRQLVIVGDPPAGVREQLAGVVRECGLRDDDVCFAGFVPDVDLVGLYNACALYVFPSRCEGFGLPALEAMACGAPVIGANASSLPEVIGHDEAMFDPESDQAMSRKMLAALSDEDLRRRLLDHAGERAGLFSWEATADTALRAFEAWRPAPSPRPRPVAATFRTLRVTDAQAAAELVRELGTAPVLAIEDARTPMPMPPRDAVDGPEWNRLLYEAGGYPAVARQALGAADWREWVQARGHGLVQDASPDALGERVVAALGVSRWDALARQCAALHALPGASGTDWPAIAHVQADNHPPARAGRTLFVDVSHLSERDAGTGVQRVVRNILREVLEQVPEGWRLEPVRFDGEGRCICAREFAWKFMELPLPALADAPAEPRAGDVLLGLDLSAHIIPTHFARFDRLRQRGVRMYFVVYDLVPLSRPDAINPVTRVLFEKWYESIGQLADGLCCISRAVADELLEWCDQARPARSRPLQIGWFHLGSGLDTAPSAGPPAPTRRRPRFLMVGTVEPRKGYRQALDAFEALWDAGEDLELVIVGREGWLTEAVCARLRGHREAGKRLRWLTDADDAILRGQYAQCDALLAASEAEGFGLPLVEAAAAGLAIIARDLPVFREIAGDHATYFHGFEPADLAQAIRAWRVQADAGTLPDVAAMPRLSWRESAAALLSLVFEQAWSATWRPAGRYLFPATDERIRHQVGHLERNAWRSDGTAGFLAFGPYMRLAAGQYRLLVHGAWLGQQGDAHVEVVAGGGGNAIARHGLEPGEPRAGQLLDLAFGLASDASDLEVRVYVSAETALALRGFEIVSCEPSG